MEIARKKDWLRALRAAFSSWSEREERLALSNANGNEIWFSVGDCAALCELHYYSVWSQSEDYLKLIDTILKGKHPLDADELYYEAIGLYSDFLFHCLQSTILFCQIREYAEVDVDHVRKWRKTRSIERQGRAVEDVDGHGEIAINIGDEWHADFVALLVEMRPIFKRLRQAMRDVIRLQFRNRQHAYLCFARAQVPISEAIAVLLKRERLIGL